MPEVGRFFKIVKIQHFCRSITQLVKKLQKRTLHEVIEDTLLFVLNTENAAKQSRQHARIQQRLSSNERTHKGGTDPQCNPTNGHTNFC